MSTKFLNLFFPAVVLVIGETVTEIGKIISKITLFSKIDAGYTEKLDLIESLKEVLEKALTQADSASYQIGEQLITAGERISLVSIVYMGIFLLVWLLVWVYNKTKASKGN